ACLGRAVKMPVPLAERPQPIVSSWRHGVIISRHHVLVVDIVQLDGDRRIIPGGNAKPEVRRLLSKRHLPGEKTAATRVLNWTDPPAPVHERLLDAKRGLSGKRREWNPRKHRRSGTRNIEAEEEVGPVECDLRIIEGVTRSGEITR